MQPPLYLTASMPYSGMREVLARAESLRLHAVPLVDNPDTLRLGGAIPVAALQAVQDIEQFHCAGSRNSMRPTRYRVELLWGDDHRWTFSVRTQANGNKEDTGLLVAGQSNPDDVYVDEFVEVDKDLPSSGFTADPSSLAVLGGASRHGARKAVRLGRLDLPVDVLDTASVEFHSDVTEVPKQVPAEESYTSLHRLFMNLSLQEACVCQYGVLVGLLTREDMVRALNLHPRGLWDVLQEQRF